MNLQTQEEQSKLIENGNNKTALITGILGQDGYWLTKLLLKNNYKVVGLHRRSSRQTPIYFSSFLENPNFSLVCGDITDFSSTLRIIKDVQPNLIFNLAAQSQVGVSFNQPEYTFDVTAKGVLNLLECLRILDLKSVRFYQASSSEMFGDNCNRRPTKYDERNEPYEYNKYQDINTKFNPQSPYAIAKVAAHQLCQLYRKAYGLDIRCGILMNHESEYRGEEFVTRKITKWIGRYKVYRSNDMFELGHPDTQSKAWDFQFNNLDRFYNSNLDSKGFSKLKLGNLSSSRDWGHSEDYVRAMLLIMQSDIPKDYIVSTGKTYTIEQFLEKVFTVASLNNWRDYVIIDDNLKRPSEVPYLKGDSYPIRRELGWRPLIDFDELVERMVKHDIKEALNDT